MDVIKLLQKQKFILISFFFLIHAVLMLDLMRRRLLDRRKMSDKERIKKVDAQLNISNSTSGSCRTVVI